MKKTFAVAAITAALVIIGVGGHDAQAEKVKWKMPSTFPGKLIQLGQAGKRLQKTLKEVSGGEIEMKFFEPKAIVPPLEIFDAVSSGSVDAGWSVAGYWQGKEPALGLFSAVPFGLAAGEYLAWMWYGGGEDLMNGIYSKYNLHSLVCGVIYPALERGTIDATEFSMPAIDLNLGFYQIAKHYYFPGWHQQSTLQELLMNKAKWDALSDQHKAIIQTACKANVANQFAEGEAIQGKVLATLKSKGVTIHKWPDEVIETLRKTWTKVAAEEVAKDAKFKEVWDHLNKFRKEYSLWSDLGYLK